MDGDRRGAPALWFCRSLQSLPPTEEKPDPTADQESQETEEPPLDTSPNVLEIDFDRLLAEERRTRLRQMHTYFKTSSPRGKTKRLACLQAAI